MVRHALDTKRLNDGFYGPKRGRNEPGKAASVLQSFVKVTENHGNSAVTHRSDMMPGFGFPSTTKSAYGLPQRHSRR
jgi:hypothetical protein